ncbi:MAG: FG-GAP repeat protein, partial [Chloroflexi bacterium]|nr:FG-GAP repeat protein [Chloroflexota bacterium]
MQSQRIAIGYGMLALIITFGLLLGPASFGPDGPSAEAALLSEVKKLLASDAEADDTLGFSVAISGDIAVVGAIREDAGGSPLDNFGAAYVFGRDEGGAGNWGELKKLTASDAQSLDHFGSSVAVSGDTVVVGAPVLAIPEAGPGAAYVFQRDQGGAGNWGEVKKLTASDAQALDRFGFSVAISGDTAVVGADLEDAGGANAGSA